MNALCESNAPPPSPNAMSRHALLPFALLIPALSPATEPDIEYSRDILPILSDNCFQCHGPDEGAREADRRLDTPEGAYADIEGIIAIAPGDPEASELIYMINTEFSEERMPPVDSKKSLSAQEKELLEKWIEQGGKYETHWAFQAPSKSPLPRPNRHPIDAFVRDRLEHEGIRSSSAASGHTLVRRIYLDLVGLPPSPPEIDSFLKAFRKDKASSIDALIDALMQRPAFGEKWARQWLDAARYADTNGFEKDKPREQWIYRDWVVDALNQDMPYDQFLIEQLAGDLLPNHTQEQMIATGFMRNGMVNEEGAIIPEQFRIEGVFDRMDCFGKVALGLTLQCAQCHSHKYDPISQDEYFGLFAFFNETHEAKSWVYSEAQNANIHSIRRKLQKLDQEIKSQRPDWRSELAQWESEQQASQTAWTVWDTDLQEWEGGLNHPQELDDHSILILGHPSVRGVAKIEGQTQLTMATGMRLEALLHKDLPFTGPGRSYWGTFAISEWEVYRKWPDETKWTPVELKGASADFDFKPREMHTYFQVEDDDSKDERRVGPARFLVDGDQKTAWNPDRGPILRHAPSSAAVTFKEPLALPQGSQLRVRLIKNHGGGNFGLDNQQIGRFRLALSGDSEPKTTDYHHAAALALKKPASERSSEETDAIFQAWRKSVDGLEELNTQIAALEAEYPEARTSVLHTADAESGYKHITRLLERGSWNQPKHEVKRHVPAILNPLPSENPTRLDLARWATEEDAPLTARVQVNRVWQALFGQGLVATPEDFGSRAPIPLHLDLIDWLAVDFMENGWSQKRLIKTVISSETYQQNSSLRPDLIEKDPRNELLARGPRFRAEAEIIRDIALAASGLLNPEIGGPSIFPPVPQSMIDDNYQKLQYWNEATGKDRYRRSLYTFRKRSMPDPALSSFDAPNADASCVRRPLSNTPLSALTSLNEPIFVEAAQAMGLRILKEGGNTDVSRINYGYLLATGRPASKADSKIILELLEEQRGRLADGWINTREIAFPDSENPPELPSGATPRDLASWAIASRVLLNLDETLNKN